MMARSGITVVIDGNTYTLQSSDLQSIRDMPADERSRLIQLLEVVKAQHEKSQRTVQEALLKNSGNAVQDATRGVQLARSKERLGKGDIDEIMARLIMEEKQQQKPGLQASTIYKFVAVILAIIVVLSLF